MIISQTLKCLRAERNIMYEGKSSLKVHLRKAKFSLTIMSSKIPFYKKISCLKSLWNATAPPKTNFVYP